MRDQILLSIHPAVIAVLLALSLCAHMQPATAQFLPAGADANADADAESALNRFLDEARRDGSTVIVVRPGPDPQAGPRQQDTTARTAQILEARARVEDVLRSGSTLWPNTLETLRLASPAGDYVWLLPTLATAFAAFFIGWFTITRIQKAGVEYFAYMWDPDPQTTADKARYLLFRVVLALVYAGVFFLMAMAVVVVVDPDLPASRQLIFEIALAYVIYRFMRRGVSWNLFAHDAPTHRLVNLSDTEATRMDRDWGIAVAAVLPFTAAAGFLGFVGDEQANAGLSADNIGLLHICSVAVVILAIATFTLKHWRSLQHLFAPRKPTACMARARTAAARSVPGLLLLYVVIAFVMFMYRLGLHLPAPYLAIVAPFAALFGSMITYGFALLVIQWFYNRRMHQFLAAAAAERTERVSREADLDAQAGEEMSVHEAAARFEYQPVFRSFFEDASLAVIGTLALRELGRMWGFDLAGEGSLWSASLNIVLAIVLCWLCYRAMSIFIDKRTAEEAGPRKTARSKPSARAAVSASRASRRCSRSCVT